jgi:hypothetical protein
MAFERLRQELGAVAQAAVQPGAHPARLLGGQDQGQAALASLDLERLHAS